MPRWTGKTLRHARTSGGIDFAAPDKSLKLAKVRLFLGSHGSVAHGLQLAQPESHRDILEHGCKLVVPPGGVLEVAL